MSGTGYTSHATWSKHKDTQDTHVSKKAAEAVCDLLLSEYGHPTPCPTRGFVLNAWVESGAK